MEREERKFSKEVDESGVFDKYLPLEEVKEVRKLATIEVIKDLQPIEGADAIEVATVRGWKVVVKKGEFVVGDLCVYCEIDSVMPQRPEFYFLQNSRFRIKTIKLRGQVSQGICFPISVALEAYKRDIEANKNDLPNGINLVIKLEQGLDVTELLGVTKYEPAIPAQLAGKVRGNFPSFLKKTDEERIQNMEWVLVEYKDKLFYVTEKLDGTSFTAYYNNGVFGVCSRNLDLFETEDNIHWKVARALKLEEKMKKYGANVAFQGELLGEGIQKNKYRLKGQDVFFFNIFNIDTYQYFNYKMFTNRIFEMGLKTVPVISPIIGFKLLSNVSEMLKYSEGKSQLNPNQEREGIVVRPYENIEHPKYGRISFKVISNKYLLKNED